MLGFSWGFGGVIGPVSADVTVSTGLSADTDQILGGVFESPAKNFPGTFLANIRACSPPTSPPNLSIANICSPVSAIPIPLTDLPRWYHTSLWSYSRLLPIVGWRCPKRTTYCVARRKDRNRECTP